MVAYVDGIKPDGNDLFTVFAVSGDRVLEAFQIAVDEGEEEVDGTHGRYKVGRVKLKV